MNNRITAKERGLIKGAIRRAFSRSDLRLKVIERSRIAHEDTNRPRVKKWSKCEDCKQPTPSYLIQVDHKLPIVPLDSSLEEMTWDELIDRCWCHIDLLQALCHDCHQIKTLSESKVRRDNKKRKKNK